jgi:two-component system, NarL family, sensor histidine kinase UhpB
MLESPMSTEGSPLTRMSLRRDVASVIGITLLSIVMSDYFNLNEWLYAFTRSAERFQIDELPIGVLVLLICLVWLVWRRYEHARLEIQARRQAEIRLVGALSENRSLAQENLRIQETERKHLARELHDELAQYLCAIKLDAVSIRDSGADAVFTSNAAVAIIRLVDHVHAGVRDMIGRLRPVGLDELGLIAAVEHCVEHWRQRQPGMRFQLSVRGNFESLSEAIKLTLYRLIQEGLTNIHKHAHAGRAEITLQRIDDKPGAPEELRLTVADDGRGMDSRLRHSGFGLNGMRERVEMMGGTFIIESASGGGLSLTARLPASERN